jgi:hypothetical protein
MTLAFLIVLLTYGWEEIATKGRMSQALLLAVSQVPKVHGANWGYFDVVLIGLIQRSAGPIALFTAAALAIVNNRRGLARSLIGSIGTLLLAVLLLGMIWHAIDVLWWFLYFIVSGVVLLILLALVPAALLSPRDLAGNRLDVALWAFLLAELGMITLLTRSSTGAWLNYGVQATLLLSVITARALGRSLTTASLRSLAPLALATLVIPVALWIGIDLILVNHRMNAAAVATVMRHYQARRSELFFIGGPGNNRVHGRPELVIDDWLYLVFERSGLAEQRSLWLPAALESVRVSTLVSLEVQPSIPGLSVSPSQLGFVADVQVGPLYCWRIRGASRSTSR